MRMLRLCLLLSLWHSLYACWLWPRRHLWAVALPLGARAATYRTLRPAPEVPVATAVILLRTTQEAAMDWGGPFSKPGLCLRQPFACYLEAF